MIKRFFLFLVFIFSGILFTGCIPPFINGGITATDFFEVKVKYTTFEIDAGEEDGFIESEVGELPLEDFTDGNEKNVLLRSYRSFVFTTKEEGIALTSLAFIVQSEDDCVISLSIFYDENNIGSETVTLTENVKNTVYWSNLNVMFEKNKELRVIISNPLEVGTVAFRTDSYIFIGQEVENV